MSDDGLRVFTIHGFASAPFPPWFHEAIRLTNTERLGWQVALSSALDAEHQGLTTVALGPIGLQIDYWHSLQHGVYVEIDTALGLVDRVLVPDAADWLPFVNGQLVPPLSAAGTMDVASQIDRLANALIAYARHGDGEHIDRATGTSRIDQRRDEEFRQRLRTGR